MSRIFIGIKMSEKIERFAVDWSSDKLTWPVRWIPQRNLHLTLVPPFYENNIELVVDKLKEVETLKSPAALRFHTIDYGPRPGDYRLIWAVGDPSPELERLKATIEQKLNVKFELRRFLPHLTLARFRPGDYNKFKVKNLKEKIYWQEKVKDFALFESILSPAGAEYRIIRSF